MSSIQTMSYFDLYLRKKLTILSRIIWYYDSSGVQAKNITVLYMNPFAGTFTTCAVAQKLNRRSIGIGMQEEYIKIGLRRLGIAQE